MSTMRMDIPEVWPPFALHLRSGDMELSPAREADTPELAEIARGGVRRDGIEAFLDDWDSGSDEQVARSLAQYHWSTRATFTVDDWTMEFTVRAGGRAGCPRRERTSVSADEDRLDRIVAGAS
ncbi:hypothetical protein [Brevibacterium limosum]|uniref:hypothetical protein n=1 Tax=Brevibacterium limosum TaxID=2697565 RepID=UPI001D17EF0E|nr:hypothetical protein [Brevibacterium limosum]